MKLTKSAMAVVAGALAAALQPAEAMPPVRWAARNLIIPDGTRAGETWSPELTPYVVEPLEKLGPDATDNEIAVMKSAQTGFTTLLIAAIGHSIDRDPCRMMLIQPTDSALSDFNREKLQPTIDGSEALRKRVKPQVSRSGQGSTTYSKQFPGGSLTMAIASSAADLRSKTIKKLFRDEIDEYPDDLEGQGDPLAISDARLTNFLVQGDWKKADISTPTIKGGSKIETRYLAGDQRRWHVRCPGCSDEFVFEWGSQFRFESQYPFKAHYVAPCCGTIINYGERTPLVRKGRWIATAPHDGAFASYHFDALSSPFVPWDSIAKTFAETKSDARKLRAFWNLTLGLPYEERGDAPDHVRLMERSEPDLVQGRIPPRGVLLVASADVQMRGIWFEVVAFASNRESWVVDAGYFEGDTELPDSELFAQLRDRILDHDWPDAFGRARKVDALAVDLGYRAHVVYSWVRRAQRTHPDTGQDVILATKGRDGWGHAAIGTPQLVDINLGGQRIKQGAKVWLVGTWPLKGSFYADLNKLGVKSAAPEDPPGYCHFPGWLGENYFKQITSEYLADETFRGRRRRFWKLTSSERDNHLLDCRIYNLALAEYLGLSRLTEDEWARLAKSRGLPDDALPLFKRASEAAAPASPTPAPAAEDEDIDAMLARLVKANSERFR